MEIRLRKRVTFTHDADIIISESEMANEFSKIFIKKAKMCPINGSYLGKKYRDDKSVKWLVDTETYHGSDITEVVNHPVGKNDELNWMIKTYCYHLMTHDHESESVHKHIDEYLDSIRKFILEEKNKEGNKNG